MANETTTTTANDVIHSEAIQSAALATSWDWMGIERHCKPRNMQGESTATAQFWRAQNPGTVGDGGTGFDTEFDASEASDVSNTAYSTDQVQVGVSEYAIMRTITDQLLEDNVQGDQFANVVVDQSVTIIMTAFEDDLAALLGNFSNTAGSTGVDLSLANLDTCIVGIRNRGVRAPDGLVFWLNDAAASDFESAVTSTNSAAAIYANAADRFLRLQPNANNGLTDGMIGSYKGYPIHQTTLSDTANLGADVESACFVPYTAANDAWSALAVTTKRPVRIEPERDASLRATEYVVSMRKGSGEINDDAGQTLITDA